MRGLGLFLEPLYRITKVDIVYSTGARRVRSTGFIHGAPGYTDTVELSKMDTVGTEPCVYYMEGVLYSEVFGLSPSADACICS